MENFRQRMIDELLKKVLLALKMEDSLYAYALLACMLIENQFGLSELQKECFVKVMQKQNIQGETLKQLEEEL